MENTDLKILQNELLNILKVFKEKCDENGLTYYMFFGSLIGTVRHHGFIPWDDDIDIAMPRDDYDKFVRLFKDYLSDDYFLDGYACPFYKSFSPLTRVNSKKVMIRRDRNNKEEYINAFIGLFPIDGLPTKEYLRDMQIKKIMFTYGLLRASRSSINGVGAINNRTTKENIYVRINSILNIGKILKPRKAAEYVDRTMSKYAFKGSKYCHVMDYDKLKSYYNTKDFFEKIEVPFEDILVTVPKNYDSILRSYYGDYMILPPEEKRVPRHGIQIRVNK